MGTEPRELTRVPDVAERLRVTRLALKLTQRRLCELTGLTTSAWNNAETGDSRIGVDSAILLCQATGITLDWIYRGSRVGLPMEVSEAISRVELEPPKGRRSGPQKVRNKPPR